MRKGRVEKEVMLDTLGVRVGAPQGLGLQGSVGCTVSGRLERGSVNKGLQGEAVLYDDKRNMLPISFASPSVCEERVKLDMLVGRFGGNKAFSGWRWRCAGSVYRRCAGSVYRRCAGSVYRRCAGSVYRRCVGSVYRRCVGSVYQRWLGWQGSCGGAVARVGLLWRLRLR